MSIAKKAVDSTVKRILIYTGEIIASIILLIMICLPLVFSVPMWIQRIAFGTPVDELLVNPVAWFGVGGFFIVIAGLAVVSIILGYPTVMKLIPSDGVVREVVDEDIEEEDEEAETDEEEDVFEDVEETDDLDITEESSSEEDDESSVEN